MKTQLFSWKSPINYYVNLFYAPGLFLYLLKTGKSWFFMFFRGIERDQWHEIKCVSKKGIYLILSCNTYVRYVIENSLAETVILFR